MIFLAATILVCLTIIVCTHLSHKPKCRHVWTKSEEHRIEVGNVLKPDKKATQNQCIMTCKFCGELIHLNLTTGEKIVLAEGGTPAKEDRIV